MLSTRALFRPFRIKNVELRNRIAMAPMTRSFSPGGVPGANVAAYYRRRAEAGTALIITEGVLIPHDRAGFDPAVPRLAGEPALAGWRAVVAGVQEAGGRIFAQLWHQGNQISGPAPPEGVTPVDASMPLEDMQAVVSAFGEAAANAQAVGFDGVEIHGAHGYLVDQFFWERTNRRKDTYGGTLVARTRFAADVIAEIRRRVGKDFPIGLRFSQFKIADYNAQLAKTPGEFDRFLSPLVEAGVDVLHASTRRFWEPAFENSDLTLAGWTKKLTGLPTIAVGSITLGTDMMTTFGTDTPAGCTSLDAVLERMEKDEFDMIAVGRAMIANPDWARIVEAGDLAPLVPFARPMTNTLA